VPRLRLGECLGVEPLDKWLKNTRFHFPEADLKSSVRVSFITRL
jgi:hypothetical protein